MQNNNSQIGYKQKQQRIIGLTGNSGSGKSYIASILAKEQGTFIIDCDKIAHSILLKGKHAYIETVEYFGQEILQEDGSIDRKKLGSIVFANDEKRLKLEKITHKHIILEINRQIESSNAKQIVIDAPLLIEAGLHKAVHEVWVVYADLEKRLERIIKRDKITKEQALKRFKAQTPIEEKIKFANVIIVN